jgi:hypothetical protein
MSGAWERERVARGDKGWLSSAVSGALIRGHGGIHHG